jgi:aminopeptidase
MPMNRPFKPSFEVLDKYARVLVNFALNSGQGVKKDEVVRLMANESAKPLYIALRNQILKSGAHVISAYSPDDTDREFYELASEDQLKFFPAKYLKGLSQQIDHSIGVISETDKHELEGIDPAKIMLKNQSLKPFKDWLDKKENSGRFTWTLALYGTPAMAKESGLSLSEYWDQIIKACFLDQPDPVAAWKSIADQNQEIRSRLDALQIDSLRVVGPEVDLNIRLGQNRKWLGGSGRNIPSFEIFTSPDWRGTEGYIEFNQPLYRYGSLISGIKLEFKNGRVVNSSASQNYPLLKKILEVKNSDKIGEFSLTDRNHSRITRFMAETLFDENISGPFGNTHIALGSSYDDAYTGDLNNFPKTQKNKLGFNDCAIHNDLISTSDRTVTATLSNGTQRVIYQNGEFTV